jgi:hypothetical protein
LRHAGGLRLRHAGGLKTLDGASAETVEVHQFTPAVDPYGGWADAFTMISRLGFLRLNIGKALPRLPVDTPLRPSKIPSVGT